MHPAEKVTTVKIPIRMLVTRAAAAPKGAVGGDLVWSPPTDRPWLPIPGDSRQGECHISLRGATRSRWATHEPSCREVGTMSERFSVLPDSAIRFNAQNISGKWSGCQLNAPNFDLFCLVVLNAAGLSLLGPERVGPKVPSMTELVSTFGMRGRLVRARWYAIRSEQH